MRNRARRGQGWQPAGPPGHHQAGAGTGRDLPLSQLPEGAKGYVSALATRDPERLQKLMAFGVLPGMPISLLQRAPAFVFQVGQTQVAVDERIAADILVTTGR